jgi:NAD(P)-dependent dehydrogenase (short-subunit alcohol dehydrogenase family)
LAGVSFEDRVVIVTGAGGGLGRTYALDIARRGGAVVVNDLGGSVRGGGASTAMADAVVNEIRKAGGKAVANYDDVASPEGARSMAAAGLQAFGRIDALINNAGNMRYAGVEDLPLEDLNALLAVHVGGAFNCSQAVWPHMKAQGGGRIVFTTSGAGVLGVEKLSAYGAAKGGVLGLMNCLALEGAAHGILCNAIMPNAGTRMTADIKEGELGDNPWAAQMFATFAPEFTTGIAVYLASEACTTTHGVYSSLGGRVARAFVGVTPGHQGSRTEPMNADEVAASWAEICDETGYRAPGSLTEEYRQVAEAGGKP